MQQQAQKPTPYALAYALLLATPWCSRHCLGDTLGRVCILLQLLALCPSMCILLESKSNTAVQRQLSPGPGKKHGAWGRIPCPSRSQLRPEPCRLCVTRTRQSVSPCSWPTNPSSQFCNSQPSARHHMTASLAKQASMPNTGHAPTAPSVVNWCPTLPCLSRGSTFPSSAVCWAVPPMQAHCAQHVCIAVSGLCTCWQQQVAQTRLAVTRRAQPGAAGLFLAFALQHAQLTPCRSRRHSQGCGQVAYGLADMQSPRKQSCLPYGS